MPAYKLGLEETVISHRKVLQYDKDIQEAVEEDDDDGDDEEEEDAGYENNDDEDISQEGEEDHVYIVGNSFELKSPNNISNEMEKQISVDPVSLKQIMFIPECPPPLPPIVRPKFVSASLPCSASSSPQADARRIKKWNNVAPSHIARQRSAAVSRREIQQGDHLRRSKSCGEGRSSAPSDEFDILSRKSSIDNRRSRTGVQILYEAGDDNTSESSKDREETKGRAEEDMKCGALCLFLPGLSKKSKQISSSYKEEREEKPVQIITPTFSRTVSLEKFECGSWASMAIDDDDDGAGVQSYFDLPLELIRSSGNDAESPVRAAFVFERNRKGVLKKSSSRSGPRMSHESNRHVRFSTSTPVSYPTSPTSVCISPRLRKAREDFNAFLEATQTA